MKTTDEPYFPLFEYRDMGTLLGFFLVLFMVILYLGQLPHLFSGPQVASIEVEGLCCGVPARSARNELAKVPGIIGIDADYRSQTIYLTLRNSQPTSPLGIWEAIERTSLRPIRLRTELETYHKKPGI